MAWWRAHDEAVDDPKLQRLSGDLFKTWFNLLCLASRNGGLLPPMKDIAFGLRKSEKEVKRVLDALIGAGLFDVSETGTEPHNWNGRQYQSDVSTNRVRQFRKRKKERSNVTDETVSGNAPEQSRADIGAPPTGRTPEDSQKPPLVAAREASPVGAIARDTASVLKALSDKKRASLT